MPVDQIKSDASIMAALGRQMTRAMQSQTLATENLANATVPGYRAREIAFETQLERTGVSMTATNGRHLASPNMPNGAVITESMAEGSAERNGNNVQLDRELLAMNKALSDFGAAQTVLSAKFRLVRYAINDGR